MSSFKPIARETFAVAALGAVALSAAACGVHGSSNLRASAVLPAAVSKPPAWAAGYMAAEVKDYRAALAAFTQIERQEEPIWASGRVSADARATFGEDWANAAIPLAQLSMWQQNGLRESGIPVVVSSRMKSYRVEQSTAVVDLVIRQCVDSADVVVDQRGRSIPWRGATGARLVEMYKLPSGTWVVRNTAGAGKC